MPTAQNQRPSGASSPLPRPRTPRPWCWQCHKCRAWFPLSCTRRCLYCGHVFCQRVPDNDAGDTSQSSKTRRRNKDRGPCLSTFDYSSWAVWGSWKRMNLLRRRKTREVAKMPVENTQPHKQEPEATSQKEKAADNTYATWELTEAPSRNTKSSKRWTPASSQTEALVLRQKEEMYVRRAHDCSLHCDCPSECRHAIYDALQRAETNATSTSGSDDVPQLENEDDDTESLSGPPTPPEHQELGHSSPSPRAVVSSDDLDGGFFFAATAAEPDYDGDDEFDLDNYIAKSACAVEHPVVELERLTEVATQP